MTFYEIVKIDELIKTIFSRADMKIDQLIRTFRKNVIFLLVLVVMICSVGAVLYLGSANIYQRESEKQHQKALFKLSSAEKALEIIFAVFEDDLLFLRDLSLLKTYVVSGFRPGPEREDVERLFRGFLSAHLDFHAIELYNETGRQVLAVEEDVYAHAREHLESSVAMTREPSSPDLSQLREDSVWISPIAIHLIRSEDQTVRMPVIGLSAFLPGSTAARMTGYITLSMKLDAIMQVLPAGVHIQTEKTNMLIRRAHGSVSVAEAPVGLAGDSGWLSVSPGETLHYLRCAFLPGQAFYVVVDHKHPGLRSSFRKLIWLSVSMLAAFSGLAAVVGFITISRYSRLVSAQHGIIFSLAALAEGRDPETGEHLERTREYAVLLAKQLKKRSEYRKTIAADYLEALYDAAPLHDIGKVGIPDAILLKESGLTEQEYQTMKTHVLIGNRVLKSTMESYKLNQKIFTVGLNIATFHHERYDGQGYPEGLKGEEIPLEARIFALCDAYDVIRSSRPYKDEVPHEEAVQRILKDKGTHFDPVVVDAFMEIETRFRAVSEGMK